MLKVLIFILCTCLDVQLLYAQKPSLLSQDSLTQKQAQQPSQSPKHQSNQQERFAIADLYHFDLNGQPLEGSLSYFTGQYREEQDLNSMLRRLSAVHIQGLYRWSSLQLAFHYRWFNESLNQIPTALDYQKNNQELGTNMTELMANGANESLLNGTASMKQQSKLISQAQQHLLSLALAYQVIKNEAWFYKLSIEPKLRYEQVLTIDFGYQHWLQYKNYWFNHFFNSISQPFLIVHTGFSMGLSISRALLGLGWGWRDWTGQGVETQWHKLMAFDRHGGLTALASLPMSPAFHLHIGCFLDIQDLSSGTIMLVGLRWTGEKEGRESDEALKGQLKSNPLDQAFPGQNPSLVPNQSPNSQPKQGPNQGPNQSPNQSPNLFQSPMNPSAPQPSIPKSSQTLQ